MKTIVIVGATYQLALEELTRMCQNNNAKIKESAFTSEALIDGQPVIAMGGAPEDVCWLRELGFHIERIDVIEPHLISEPMGKRINHVRSTIRSMRLGMKLGE